MAIASTTILDKISPRRILMVFLGVLLVGIIFYHFVEKLSYVDSFYFCVVTLATVGYGDITPHTPLGKIFTSFYILIGVGIIASTGGYLLRYVAEHRVTTHLAKHLAEQDEEKSEKK